MSLLKTSQIDARRREVLKSVYNLTFHQCNKRVRFDQEKLRIFHKKKIGTIEGECVTDHRNELIDRVSRKRAVIFKIREM